MHPSWLPSLELSASDEHNGVRDSKPRVGEHFPNHADVPVVLSKRILESVFAPKELLRPCLIFLTAEYPATHVLGFDDVQPGGPHYDVVDLGRGPVARAQGHVIQYGELIAGQRKAQIRSNKFLPGPPFDSWKLEEKEQTEEDEEPPK